ncbi:MAG: GNAT family N-acetyltransferase [Planctomycetes bacterium]|nr:GNAT family N-acetyltransferase [Planctomycetota bacterium]
MPEQTKRPQLLMCRPNLNDLPSIQVPEGYEVRTYQPGDEAVWADVVNRSFGGKERTAENAREVIMNRPQFEPDRLFFVTKDGEAVGTACAWERGGHPEGTGYLHMVGVVPGHQGHGLGKLLVSLVLDCFRRKGYRQVMLHTDDFRLPAIKSYLRAGFDPVIRDDEERLRWDAIRNQIADT